MASRFFQQFPKSLIKEVCSIFAAVPIGATGAVGTLDPKRNMGIQSVVRVSTGQYLITLGSLVSQPFPQIDKYDSLLDVSFAIINPTISAVQNMTILSDAVHSAGQVTVQFSAAGSAVDPDNGAFLRLEIKVKNSAVQ